MLIHGPRQCGKTTLAQRVGRKLGYAYFNRDEDVSRAAAEADPVGCGSELPERVVLDEIAGDLAEPGYIVTLTRESLKAHPTWMVDTRHFDGKFTARLLWPSESYQGVQ